MVTDIVKITPEQQLQPQISFASDLTIGGFLNPSSALFSRGNEHGKKVALALDDKRQQDQKLINLRSSMEQELSQDRLEQLEQQITLEQQARIKAEARMSTVLQRVSGMETRMQEILTANSDLELENAKISKENELSRHCIEKLRAKIIDTKELQQRFVTAELALESERDLRKAIEMQVVEPIV
ncbi:MAG: hypothetical protein COB50_03590 [Thiotrichales bacterium]|nr:MAG: hypothetical protein COB50_03590 [Thiotrichales bacterium]